MIEIFAKPLGALLNIIYSFLINVGLEFSSLSAYAISIILATIIVRLIILPLTLKQTKSMREMQLIQPQLQELQKKYKNDKETLNVKTMELYKEHKVNPLGGCLPLLIQFPIIIGFFRVLREPQNYVANYEAIANKSFLWVKDIGYAANHVFDDGLVNGLGLGIDIPFIGAAVPLLAIYAGLTTYYQSKMMGANSTAGNAQAQSTQKTMTTMMPIMIFVFALGFPAGLTLYWAIGNTFQIIQQYFTNRSMGQIKGESN